MTEQSDTDRDPAMWGDLDLRRGVFMLDNGEDLPVIELLGYDGGVVSNPITATSCRVGPRADGAVLTVTVDRQDKDAYTAGQPS